MKYATTAKPSRNRAPAAFSQGAEAGRSQQTRPILSDKLCNAGILVLIVAYVIIGFAVADDYGLTMHGENCMGLGHKNMHYYLTGELDYSNTNSPTVPGIDPHLLYSDEVSTRPESYYPFDALLSTATCWLFYQKLHILDHVTAHAISVTLLTAVLLYFLYRFARHHWSPSVALLAVCILITCPRFFGETMYNFRADVALAILFSMTLISLAEWFTNLRAKHLYVASITFACGVATKPDIIFAPVIVLLWSLPMLLRSAARRQWPSRWTVLHLTLSAGLAFLIILALYPIFHPFQGQQLEYLKKMYTTMRANAFWPTVSWNIYAPEQIFFTTPEIVLLLAGVGAVFALKGLRKDRALSLLLIWTLFPVLRHCLPYVNHYDGIRHFLYFYVPFSVLAALGVTAVADVIVRISKIPRMASVILITICLISQNVYALVAMHPYQTSYFNAMIGGLGGAQSRNFPFACDYLALCHREAGQWLDENAKPNAHYFVGFGQSKFRHHFTRRDVREIWQINKVEDILRFPPFFGQVAKRGFE